VRSELKKLIARAKARAKSTTVLAAPYFEDVPWSAWKQKLKQALRKQQSFFGEQKGTP
jgi:hypothetical protein